MTGSVPRDAIGELRNVTGELGNDAGGELGNMAEELRESASVPWELPIPLGSQPLTPEQRAHVLSSFRSYVERQSTAFLGYQATQDLHFEADLGWLLDHHLNNLGDPFTEGNFTLNSKPFERAVLDHFAELWHARTPHDPHDGDSYWGSVLTMGSSEGNMYGLWNARDYLGGRALIMDPRSPVAEAAWIRALPDPDNPNAYRPVAFFSADTHYSLTKAVRALGISTFQEVGSQIYPDQCPLGGSWPAEVPSVGGNQGSGCIDVGALCTLVDFFASKGHPPLISLNLGTAFKGAHDPVEEICTRVVEVLHRHGLYRRTLSFPPVGAVEPHSEERHGFWIHVDGALGAAYLPYLRAAQARGDSRVADVPPIPAFDFGLEHVFSLVMSGHKWLGTPWPCGVYMTRVGHQLRPQHMPAYVGAPDTTFAGSRNGFSAVVLWDHLASHSFDDQVDRICNAESTARYAEERLRALGGERGLDLWVARTPGALSVRFRRPAERYVFRHSLSTEQLSDDGGRQYAHIFVMPGIGPDDVDRLIADLARAEAYPGPTDHTERRLPRQGGRGGEDAGEPGPTARPGAAVEPEKRTGSRTSTGSRDPRESGPATESDTGTRTGATGLDIWPHHDGATVPLSGRGFR